MATQLTSSVQPELLANLLPGQFSIPAAVRPAKTNFYPMELYVRSTANGDKFNVQLSPTTDRDDWVTIVQLTVNVLTADAHFTVLYRVLDLAERIRVQMDPTAAGVGEALLIPGA